MILSGIHSLLLLTHVDRVYPGEVCEIFHSDTVRDIVHGIADKLDYGFDDVLPICNYCKYTVNSMDENILSEHYFLFL